MNENSRPKTLQINQWLERATHDLLEVGITSARLDAEIILAHTLKQPRTYLHAHGDDEIPEREHEIADARLALREDRVPIAYIIGHKEFYGRRFSVTTATLIPRPESETLIEAVKRVVPSTANLLGEEKRRLVDVGTGSGALGITAKLELPELDVTLLDISRYALGVAERNARLLKADVTIMISNLLESYPFQADIIVANLPYVSRDWERSPETNHEPELALFADDDGLGLIKKLIADTSNHLKIGGHLILEADPEQHTRIIRFAGTYGLSRVDINGYAVTLKRDN